MVVSGSRWALLRETPEPPPLRELAARLAPVDLVLVEGFKTDDFPKIEVHRPALGKTPLWPGMGSVVAVASDDSGLACVPPLLPLNDAAEIARFVAGFVAAGRGAA
jgi:molybdopterin-guanine dinucleotide biosynthesis protein B